MDIPELNIPLIRQDPESDDCLLCCAQMVFNYLGDPKTGKEVWKKLHVYKKKSGLGEGAYDQDLGKLGLTKGYKAIIYHYAWDWWNKETVVSVDQGKQDLVTSLKNLSNFKKKWSDRRVILKEIAFLNNGGQFKFEIPKLETINYYLKKDIPVILSVKGEVICHDPEENYLHAILVIGKKGENYIIRDPYLGVKSMPADELYFAWATAWGWMVVIEKNSIIC